MSIRHHIFPEERKQMQREALREAIKRINGPVGFYECWLSEEPQLALTEEAMKVWRPFCSKVWECENLKEKCYQDHMKRAQSCEGFQVDTCWLGVNNMACALEDEYGGELVILGGVFRIREWQEGAEKLLRSFLDTLPQDQRKEYVSAWEQIPEVSEEEVRNYKMRELKSIGRNYLHAIHQLSDFRYKADLTAHDVVIALQVIIAEIEVLKIEMKKAFGIGQKWEDRFEDLISACEGHNWYLKARLELEKPHYEEESISKLIYECVDLYSPKAKERGIEIFVDLEQLKAETGKHKVLTIPMNRSALKNAFSNALDNAIKYSFDGTASKPRWVEIIGKLKKINRIPGYLIAISNLGVGIEEDELEAVFRPGYQGRQRLHTGHPGFGMGLTILKEVVEKHGGQININSLCQTRSAWLTTLNIWLPLHGPMGQFKERSDG